MPNSLTYKVYRAAAAAGQLTLQADGSVWKLVSTLSQPAGSYLNSATLEFTDSTVVAGTTYFYRITVTDSLGNESLAQAEEGIFLRRHLDMDGADLTGKIRLGWSAEAASATTSWVYVLDPAASETAGAGGCSLRWVRYATAGAPELDALERIYRQAVVDPTLPAAPYAAALAHGGDGQDHGAQSRPATLIKDGLPVDVVDWTDWEQWVSNFGQNYPAAWYAEQLLGRPYRAKIEMADGAEMPAVGDTISLFGQVELTFAAAGFAPGSGLVQTMDGLDSDAFEGSTYAQLLAIAAALNRAVTPPLPLKAWVDPAALAVLVEADGVFTADPALESSCDSLVCTALEAKTSKLESRGAADTDLTPYGEGSGQGFFRDYGQEALGHLHLRVDWQDAGAERGVLFERGVVLVNGLFFAQYRPGEAWDGIADYVVTSSPLAGRRLAADGRTPTTIEIRKYHPLGHYASFSLVKVCPCRAALRRLGAARPDSRETFFAYSPFAGAYRLALDPDPQWALVRSRPELARFASWEAYRRGAAQNPDLLGGYYDRIGAHPDLGAQVPELTLALALDAEVVLPPDPLQQPLPVALGGALRRAWPAVPDAVPDLALRARFWDGWGLDEDGLFQADLSLPGNASLWSVPVACLSCSGYSWAVEGLGTESYLVPGDETAAPGAPRAGSPYDLYYGRAREARTLATRSWSAGCQGSMTGWRTREDDESRQLALVLGHPARRALPTTVSVALTSLEVADAGDAPLLRDGETLPAAARHEVATYLPRTYEMSLPVLTHRQLELGQPQLGPAEGLPPAGALLLDLAPGQYQLRYGYGQIQTAPRRALVRDARRAQPALLPRAVVVGLNLRSPEGHDTRCWGRSFASLEELKEYLRGGGVFETVTLDVAAPGRWTAWACGDPSLDRAALSVTLTLTGQARLPVERAALPVVLNDFINAADADAGGAKRASGAPRCHADADTLTLAGTAQWHDADLAFDPVSNRQGIPAGDYPLHPDPALDGPELDLVAHAPRGEQGLLVQVGEQFVPPSADYLPVSPTFTLQLPPLVPLVAQDFGKKVSGWGAGNAQVVSETFTGVAEPRIAPAGSCRGLRVKRPTVVYGPSLPAGEPIAWNTIVVASPDWDVELLWVSGGVLTPVALRRLGRQLWVSAETLPSSAPERLAVRWSRFDLDSGRYELGTDRPRQLWGVWCLENAVRWQAKASKDGAAWDGATGSRDWTDLGESLGSLTQATPLQARALSWDPGRYELELRAVVHGAAAAQTAGNALQAETLEETLGLITLVKVEVP